MSEDKKGKGLKPAQVIATELIERELLPRFEDIKKRESFQEFLNLIYEGTIPPDSTYLVARMRGEVDGEKRDDIPVEIAILPNGNFQILESGPNVDVIRSQQEEDGKAKIFITKVDNQGTIKQTGPLSERAKAVMDSGGVVLRNLKMELMPNKDGLMAEIRSGEKPVLQAWHDRVIILDWEEAQNYKDTRLEVNGLKLVEVIQSKALHDFIDKHAGGEYPEDTVFLFDIMQIQQENGEVKKVMAAPRALLPDGEVKPLGIEIIIEGQKLTTDGPVTIIPKNDQKCPECDKIFTQGRSDQIYCSKRCKNRFLQREWRKKNP